MAKKVDGTDNVFVLGVNPGKPVIRAQNQNQVDSMLSASLDIQRQQINDFVEDIRALDDSADIEIYGSLMKHLQQECVLHLSALAAAALMEIRELREPT